MFINPDSIFGYTINTVDDYKRIMLTLNSEWIKTHNDNLATFCFRDSMQMTGKAVLFEGAVVLVLKMNDNEDYMVKPILEAAKDIIHSLDSSFRTAIDECVLVNTNLDMDTNDCNNVRDYIDMMLHGVIQIANIGDKQ